MSNRPRAMLERLAYASWLGVTGASVVAVLMSMVGALTGEGFGALLVGSVGIVLCHIINGYGRRRLHFDECERTLEFRGVGALFSESPEHQDRAESMRKALDEWSALDERSLTHDIDIWRRQALRQQVNSLLAADPGLRREFREELEDRDGVE